MQVYGRTATWCGATREGVVRDGGARARAEAGSWLLRRLGLLGFLQM
ncbi:hypothetical protein E1A91_D01G223000v1 [Gossypium mustelinum]|uniref:Uncharacterized protein n=1 Tax=Gossypium mustelinum TaxID=34275 RepID=A0A5D2W9N4_GOSMU|nr:hypothetical protein E1A91_D01G223000v1 [Gossypium mustelinum]